ncbi:MFS transporter [Paraburkholderia dipogonis]|uniref:MFS transporter n=2 Tax=Paraburkholderia dipogonis TaxID=1211383 RepID=A0A4Y8MUI4_9BURK|nr:MFS transporter [Paraburkholderia dipogonis]TFE41121.1 MFS transporter [Paraburkholderia dipogonis]
MTDATNDDWTFRRIGWRVIPFLFACYVLNFVDRVNVGFAKLQFMRDLHLDESVFGIATACFFVAYAAFEVPSNLLLARVGASKTLRRIMVLWGTCTVLQMFMTSAPALYVLRFLLGAAEAGFFPGMILFMTYWFPDRIRARVNSILLLAVPIAGMLGGPLSGWIMSNLHGSLGLRGWQWLFLIEGLPAVALGVLAPFLLSDSPHRARWLTPQEKETVQRALQADIDASAARLHANAPLRDIFRAPRVLTLSAVYFCIFIGLVAVTFWLPTILHNAGVANLSTIGWIAGLVSLLTMTGNLAIAYSSDRFNERRWHVAGCGSVAAACLLGLHAASHSVAATVVLLAVAQMTAFTMPIIFWTIPVRLLSGRSAAVGIAFISMSGSIGGAVSSWLIGSISARTGSPYVAMSAVAAVLMLGMMLLLGCVKEAQRPAAGTAVGATGS